ncbi:hypothetical protein BDA99DRAFT_297621 [Phascolomyces articulosus]|uniref:Secreted protein n=1 Tax=Phascolomyces articulosus TaxID=60185 RepID=A0AAD5PH50_9FUNG|nr:hypothetical protein BDA99DRAFT_297621 [Phascolomyces articulosus]
MTLLLPLFFTLPHPQIASLLFPSPLHFPLDRSLLAMHHIIKKKHHTQNNEQCKPVHYCLYAHTTANNLFPLNSSLPLLFNPEEKGIFLSFFFLHPIVHL